MSNFKKLILIVIINVMTIILCAYYLKINAHSDLRENVEVVIDGNSAETFKANISGLYPGKTLDYKININDKKASDYEIKLKFHKDDGGLLKDFIIVDIKANNVSIQKKLSELFNGDALIIGENITTINISYTMPKDVGNESQKTSVSFYIDLLAEYR